MFQVIEKLKDYQITSGNIVTACQRSCGTYFFQLCPSFCSGGSLYKDPRPSDVFKLDQLGSYCTGTPGHVQTSTWTSLYRDSPKLVDYDLLAIRGLVFYWSAFLFRCFFFKKGVIQDCIPVGCIPPAC